MGPPDWAMCTTQNEEAASVGVRDTPHLALQKEIKWGLATNEYQNVKE
jgi:hypothetical protein